MRYKTLNAGNDFNRFSDPLQRTTGLGPNWAIGFHNPSQAGWFNPEGAFVTLSSGLNLNNPTGGGSAVRIMTLPLNVPGLLSVAQFSELQIVNGTGAASFSGGPLVFGHGDVSNGTASNYVLGINLGNTTNLVSSNGTTDTVLIANAGAWANGDVFRLAITPTPPQGPNLLTIFRNGTAVRTFTDPAISNSVFGLPGIYFGGASAANAIKFINFRCGPGLGS
jgi:hypothetical protein